MLKQSHKNPQIIQCLKLLLIETGGDNNDKVDEDDDGDD
jgi:hypothetical protein